MELKSKELLILENALDSLIEHHEREIEEIKSLDENHYKYIGVVNKFLEKKMTVEDAKRKDIEKELICIKEIKQLKEKLFFSDSALLLVSSRIQLMLSSK